MTKHRNKHIALGFHVTNLIRVLCGIMNIKFLLCFLVFSNPLRLLCQTSLEMNIFFDVVAQNSNPENESEIGYLKSLDSGILNRSLKDFSNQKSLTYSMLQRNTGKVDSIIISSEEKKYLISQLKKYKNFEWNLKQSNDLVIVNQDSVLNYLQENNKRKLKMVSKPVLLRNNSIACILSVHLCCGHILGHHSLSFYKNINGKWTEWININGGDW